MGCLLYKRYPHLSSGEWVMDLSTKLENLSTKVVCPVGMVLACKLIEKYGFLVGNYE